MELPQGKEPAIENKEENKNKEHQESKQEQQVEVFKFEGEGEVIKIKRKRNEAPLDSFGKLDLSQLLQVVDPEPSAKRVPLETVIKQMAQLRTKELEVEVKKEEPKLRKFTPNLPTQSQPKPKPGLKKSNSFERLTSQIRQDSRAKAVAASRKKDEDDYVVDIYYVDNKAQKEEIDHTLVVRLESFDEELVLENEYDKDSGYGEDEDSNGEKDYPTTEEDFSLESDGSGDDYDAQFRSQRMGAVFHEYDLNDEVDEEILNLYGTLKTHKNRADSEDEDSSDGEVYY